MAAAHPYQEWLDKYLIELDDIEDGEDVPASDMCTVIQRQQAFGYTYEQLRKILGPMATDAVEPVGAMGNDTPLAVLSDVPQLLYNYFRQLFAQVTNPPIDAIREEIITDTGVMMGTELNLLETNPTNCRQIRIKTPVLTNEDLAKIRHLDRKYFRSETFPILFDPNEGSAGMEAALEDLFADVDAAIEDGANILVLSDRGMGPGKAAIPALLAVSGLHHHLIRTGKRTQVTLILESGEPREVHHFAVLIGYGASAINPYVGYETVEAMAREGMLGGTNLDDALYNYRKALIKGAVKTCSKMGISTIQSYCGAQIFEALGLKQSFVDRYFTWTPTRVEGIGLEEVAEETIRRHRKALPSALFQRCGAATGWRLSVATGWRTSPVQSKDDTLPAALCTRE